MRVGIVGAGVAGFACADRLSEYGIEVALFDKGKRPGGRASTLTLGGQAWDFGAQYFTARDPLFVEHVARWEAAGHVARWAAGPEEAWVGVPGMASILAAGAARHTVRFGAQVQAVHPSEEGWHLAGPGVDDGPFDAVCIAVPAEQAASLIGLHDMMMAREAATVRSAPCWTLMIAFPERIAALPDVLRPAGAIAWAARDSSKPGRPDAECWVIQAEGDWSARNLERNQDDIAEELLRHFCGLAGAPLPDPVFLKAHRWRFALPRGGHGAPMWNAALRLGACGDWCAAPRIEAAWLSGHALGGQMAETLGLVRTTEAA